MGLVCASILAGGDGPGPRPGRRVVVWGHSRDEVDQLAQSRTSPRLPRFVLPPAVEVTDDLGVALAGARPAGLVVSAVPVQFMREVWARAAGVAGAGAAAVSVAKGIENGTLRRPTQIMAECLSAGGRDASGRVAALSGPTIAPELARCLPAAMIAASTNAALASAVQGAFSSSWLRVYTHADVTGVEVAGAMKNVIAIAAGVLDGLNAGYNAKSALLARGLAEIVRLGVAMGAQPPTFFGIAGVGDLATTCFSPEGRNRSCGEALGRGEALSAYLARTPSVVEGVATTRSVVELADRLGVDMPITAAVHAVLFEGVDPIEAIGRLMSRASKAETVG